MTRAIQICGIVTALAFLTAAFTATILAYVMTPQTYRRLVLAVQWERIAVGLAVMTLLLGLAHTSLDGSKWWIPAIWTFNTACAAACLRLICKTRDRKGEQLVDDALHQLNDWGRW